MCLIYCLLILFFLLIFVNTVYSIVNCKIVEGLTESSNPTENIILLGDSMLENSNYVNKEHSVTELVKNYATQTKRTFYNFAVDGSTIQSVLKKIINLTRNQLKTFNTVNTHIFLSVGGNDILKINQPIETESINSLFKEYIHLIECIQITLPRAKLTVLNLYAPNVNWIEIYKSSIKQWNQLLETRKNNHNYTILNVNSLLFKKDDFTYDIEPSVSGGKKIAESINNLF